MFPLVLLGLFLGAYFALSIAGNPQERRIAQNARATNGARECMSATVRARVDQITHRLGRRSTILGLRTEDERRYILAVENDPTIQILNGRLEQIFRRYQPGGAAYEEECYERGARRYNHVPD